MTVELINTMNNSSPLPSGLLQPWINEFDEIRGFFDEEVHPSVTRLCSDKDFTALLTSFFSLTQSNNKDCEHQGNLKQSLESTFTRLHNITSIATLQELTILIASPIIDMTISHLSFSGLDKLPTDKHYLFISNHRDILTDPLLLNVLLHKHNYKTAHCAIGDNLLQNHIALEIALLNKCFKILRSLTSPRAILKAMKLQATYIRHLSFNQSANIWIAQKEGRSKDNLDKTNPTLIKMLGLAKPKDMLFGEYIKELNIIPVSFSYEWDPCDIDKATELEITEQQGHYKKESIEDFTAVKKGLLQAKGSVHVHFGSELLGQNIDQMKHVEIAELIDQSIAQNSQVYPVNIAAALAIGSKNSNDINTTLFSENEIEEASEALERRLENCSEKIRTRVLMNYATPIIR